MIIKLAYLRVSCPEKKKRKPKTKKDQPSTAANSYYIKHLRESKQNYPLFICLESVTIKVKTMPLLATACHSAIRKFCKCVCVCMWECEEINFEPKHRRHKSAQRFMAIFVTAVIRVLLYIYSCYCRTVQYEAAKA